jgi:putative membrane protein
VHRFARLVPLIAVTALIAALGGGSLALARDNHGGNGGGSTPGQYPNRDQKQDARGKQERDQDKGRGHKPGNQQWPAGQPQYPGQGGSTGGQPQGPPPQCDQQCRDKGYSAADEQWLKMAAAGDVFEIQSGKVAARYGKTPLVRKLGERLVADHSQAYGQKAAVAGKLGIALPKEPTPTQQWQFEVLASFKGKAFDRWFADLAVKDHVQEIAEATEEAQKGCNADIKQLAAATVPVLQEHLKLAEAALAALGRDRKHDRS